MDSKASNPYADAMNTTPPSLLQNRIRGLISVWVWIIPALLQAQQPTFDWATLLTAAEGQRQVRSVAADANGHAIVAYYNIHRAPDGLIDWVKSGLDNVVTKVDATGNLLWSYGLLPNIFRLAVGPHGHVYVLGSLNRGEGTLPLPADYLPSVGISPEGSGGFYVARLSPTGQLDWFRLIGGVRTLFANQLAVDVAGNYYVAGRYSPPTIHFDDITLPAPASSSARHFFVVKFSPDGRAVWAKAGIGSYSSISLNGLVVDGTGNLVLGVLTGDQGYTLGGVPLAITDWEPTLVKLDPDGNVLWSTSPGASMHAVDQEGSIYAARDWTVRKYRPDGTKAWEWGPESPAVLGGFGQPWDGGIGVDADGNCILSGTFRSQSSPEGARLPFGQLTLGDTVLTTIAQEELIVAKVSRDGKLIWATQSDGQDSSYDHWMAYERGDPSLPYSTVVPRMTVSPGGPIIIAGTLGGAFRFGSHLVEGPHPTVYDGTVAVGGRSPVFATRLIEPQTATPTLGAQQVTKGLRLSWPVPFEGFVLESINTIPSGAWNVVSTAPTLEGDEQVVTVETSGASGFYRLRRP